jgi:hypothetical protein
MVRNEERTEATKNKYKSKIQKGAEERYEEMSKIGKSNTQEETVGIFRRTTETSK